MHRLKKITHNWLGQVVTGPCKTAVVSTVRVQYNYQFMLSMPITIRHLVKPSLQQNSTRYTNEKPGYLHKSPNTAKAGPNDAYDRIET